MSKFGQRFKERIIHPGPGTEVDSYEEGELSGQKVYIVFLVAPVHRKNLRLIFNSGSSGFHFIKGYGPSPQSPNCN